MRGPCANKFCLKAKTEFEEYFRVVDMPFAKLGFEIIPGAH